MMSEFRGPSYEQMELLVAGVWRIADALEGNQKDPLGSAMVGEIKELRERLRPPTGQTGCPGK
jgi:hypothetical protein